MNLNKKQRNNNWLQQVLDDNGIQLYCYYCEKMQNPHVSAGVIMCKACTDVFGEYGSSH